MLLKRSDPQAYFVVSPAPPALWNAKPIPMG
jgi:hypothetical protein